MKKFTIVLLFALLVQLVSPFTFAQAKEPLVYTPLGDSLASGVNENSELGNGYADFIAQSLSATQAVDFTKLYTCPGYKTTNVLADIQSNITDTNCPYKEEPTNLTPLQVRLAQSDVITISAGANDLLQNVTIGTNGQPSINLQGVLATMNQVPNKYKEILTLIRSYNPTAKIVIMGFYNPMPHVAAYKGQIDMLVEQFDAAVAAAAAPFNAQYVVVRDTVASNTALYLPNTANIHLSEAGYKAVAAVMQPVIEAPNAPAFTDVAADHWAANYIATVSNLGIMNGSNGQFQPGAPLKRIHVASMLTRLNGYNATTVAPFADIANLNEKTRQELDAAYSNGIVKGSNNLFQPQTNIQRVQLASMLLRAYEQKTGTTFVATKALPFVDTAALAIEEKRAISFLYENNIVSGTSPTTFAPRSTTTRAAAAKIFAGITTLQ